MLKQKSHPPFNSMSLFLVTLVHEPFLPKFRIHYLDYSRHFLCAKRWQDVWMNNLVLNGFKKLPNSLFLVFLPPLAPCIHNITVILHLSVVYTGSKARNISGHFHIGKRFAKHFSPSHKTFLNLQFISAILELNRNSYKLNEFTTYWYQRGDY